MVSVARSIPPARGLYEGYHRQEYTALGMGDLNMPHDCGGIEWHDVFDELTFLPGTVLMTGDRPALSQRAARLSCPPRQLGINARRREPPAETEHCRA